MSPVSVLTIDGPSGSGKGTVSRRVAERLGWHLLDSGALYRLVRWLAGLPASLQAMKRLTRESLLPSKYVSGRTLLGEELILLGASQQDVTGPSVPRKPGRVPRG